MKLPSVRARILTRGFTLTEVLVAVFVLAIVSVAISGIALLNARQARQSEQQVAALAIGNAQLELARSLDYDRVGVQGGSPDGDLLVSEVITENNQEFTVETRVNFVDDPLTAEADDYKEVLVDVFYDTPNGGTNTGTASLGTQIVPLAGGEGGGCTDSTQCGEGGACCGGVCTTACSGANSCPEGAGNWQCNGSTGCCEAGSCEEVVACDVTTCPASTVGPCVNGVRTIVDWECSPAGAEPTCSTSDSGPIAHCQPLPRIVVCGAGGVSVPSPTPTPTPTPSVSPSPTPNIDIYADARCIDHSQIVELNTNTFGLEENEPAPNRVVNSAWFTIPVEASVQVSTVFQDFDYALMAFWGNIFDNPPPYAWIGPEYDGSIAWDLSRTQVGVQANGDPMYLRQALQALWQFFGRGGEWSVATQYVALQGYTGGSLGRSAGNATLEFKLDPLAHSCIKDASARDNLGNASFSGPHDQRIKLSDTWCGGYNPEAGCSCDVAGVNGGGHCNDFLEVCGLGQGAIDGPFPSLGHFVVRSAILLR